MGIGYFFLCVKPHKLEGIPESRVLGQAIIEKSCRCLSPIPTSQARKAPSRPVLRLCACSLRIGEILAFHNYNMKILNNKNMNILCQQSRQKALQNTMYSQHHIY